MTKEKQKQLNLEASEAAKAAGYKSLKELADLEGKSTNCLYRWYHEKPHLFKAAIERHKNG